MLAAIAAASFTAPAQAAHVLSFTTQTCSSAAPGRAAASSDLPPSTIGGARPPSPSPASPARQRASPSCARRRVRQLLHDRPSFLTARASSSSRGPARAPPSSTRATTALPGEHLRRPAARASDARPPRAPAAPCPSRRAGLMLARLRAAGGALRHARVRPATSPSSRAADGSGERVDHRSAQLGQRPGPFRSTWTMISGARRGACGRRRPSARQPRPVRSP